MRSSAQTEGRESLEATAMLALEFGRLLMEAGAGAGDVEEIAVQVTAGLGASRAELRVGYASLAITIGVGSTGRIRDVDKGIQDRLAFLARQTPDEFSRAFFQIQDAALGDHCVQQFHTQLGVRGRVRFKAEPLRGKYRRVCDAQFVPHEQSLREALHQPGQDPLDGDGIEAVHVGVTIQALGSPLVEDATERSHGTF